MKIIINQNVIRSNELNNELRETSNSLESNLDEINIKIEA